MWDWELLKNGSGMHRYEIAAKFGNEDFQYTHAVSYGTQQDDYCLHSHAMYEVVYCVSGNAVYMTDGIRYALEPCSLLILSPAVLHKLFICSDEPFERHIFYIYFAGNTSPLSAMMAQCQRTIGSESVGSAYYKPDDVACLKHGFDRLSAAAGSEKEAIRALTPYFAQAMAADILMAIDGKNPARFAHSVSKTMDSITLFLSSNFTKPLTLQSVADTFSLSRDYCNRLFRKSTGMSVMQYVTYNRILYAKQLLAEGMQAQDVARRCGFSDYSSFFRAYRKITGRTPRDDYQFAEELLEKPETISPENYEEKE